MTRGLVLGTFLPPHRGHQYLIDFARHFCDEVIVVIGSLQSESIPGEQRRQWLAESFPTCTVRHLAQELPQEPHEHPDFWQLWRTALKTIVPEELDYVFASEHYGFRLAKELSAQYIPVDEARELLPICATAIREDPMRHWQYILPAARPWFVKRVCIFGPESTGKSTLTRDLARHYDTVYVAEYARSLLVALDNEFTEEDFHRIARGHLASEDALALQARGLLFVDTDLLITCLWSDVFYGRCYEWIQAAADQRSYDLYLVTDVDVAWVSDEQRFLPHERKSFRDRCIAALEERNRPYCLINGTWDERFTRATAAVDDLLASKV